MFSSTSNAAHAAVVTIALACAWPGVVRAVPSSAGSTSVLANSDPLAGDDLVASAAAPDVTPSASDTDSQAEVVVSAQRLNEARASVETQTGASTYKFDSAAIQAMPGGENTSLNQVILQAPDAAQDSFGQLHVRGEHNGLQYRLNGVILPEGISVFSQSLDPHLVNSLSLITGALPAEFGLRTAGIIDVTTKSGVFDPFVSVSLYGGSHSEYYPGFFAGGSAGALNYFVTGDFIRNNLGIESPYNAITPIHDETRQYHGFGYFEYILEPNDRVSWILGLAHGRYQIPNTPGLSPELGLTVTGQTGYPSEQLDERQTEITQYAVVSFQHVQGSLSLQSSLSARYSSLTYFPDEVGDLLYDGISQNAFKKDVGYAWQTDGEYHLLDAHTLRFGFYIQHDRADSRTSSQVLPVDPGSGMPISDIPLTLGENGSQTQDIQSVYLQDEWQLLSNLTANYGVRFDHLSAYTSGHQVGPRVNLVWKPFEGTTLHGGYSRYFSPLPFELIASHSITKFATTTAQPPGTLDSNPLPEKANYYDIGIEQKLSRQLTASIDSFYKQSTDLIDEGQFGAPIIQTPFNYRYGRQYGLEFALSYNCGPLAVYLNAATQRARGKDIVTSQFNFDALDLRYTANHYIPLDHEQQYTGSAGVSYLRMGTRLSLDMLYGSGLREDLPVPGGIPLANGETTNNIPNGAHLPYYRQVNMGISHTFAGLGWGAAKNSPTLRFDVINLFDTAYQIRNGSGIGVGAPQWGPRRGFFGGITLPLY